MQKAEWYKVREIAYASIIGPSYDPKKIPKTRERFMPLDGKKDVTDEHKQRFIEAQKKYLREKTEKENGR